VDRYLTAYRMVLTEKKSCILTTVLAENKVNNYEGVGDVRKITPSEILALKTLLETETSGLAVSSAAMMAISDEQLKTSMQSGLVAVQARIQGLQQFIAENNLADVTQAEKTKREEGGLFNDVFGQ
jgi:hypothetical protein